MINKINVFFEKYFRTHHTRQFMIGLALPFHVLYKIANVLLAVIVLNPNLRMELPPNYQHDQRPNSLSSSDPFSSP